jgi:uncharacterized lipoprotein
LKNKNKSVLALAALGLIVTLSGCVSAPIPLNYSPSSVKTAAGSLSVGDFRYLPSETGAAKIQPPDQIRNTAIGSIKIDKPVKVFVRDAVFAELRFVGIKTNDPAKVLTGEIEEFLVDDLGFNVDWTLRIHYVLSDAVSKSVLYQGVKTTQRKTAKFANPFGAINETVKLDVELLLDDADFIKAIN